MPCAVSFAEMLEAELNCTNVPPRARHASSAWNRPLTTPLLVFEYSRPPANVRDEDLRSPKKQERTSPFREFPPAPPRTPLNARETRALMALNALGADLDGDLSVAELRRAFRRLARRYHPDRHPGSNTAEQERLARAFVEATEHYRVLAATLARSG
jgi:hypothetical protein